MECGAAIGTTRVIELKRSWREHPIVWAASVGPSGSLKSPAQDLATQPLRLLQAERFHDHDEAEADYQREVLQYEKELLLWKKNKDTKDPPVKPEETTPERL